MCAVLIQHQPFHIIRILNENWTGAASWPNLITDYLFHSPTYQQIMR
jgi:hypothetical protein